MSTILFEIISFVTVIGLIIAYFTRSFLDFRVSHFGIEFVIFRAFRVYTIPFAKILKAETIDWHKTLLEFCFSNRIWNQDGAVVITKTNGSTVIVTPDYPDEFVLDINEHLGGAIS